MLAVRSIPFLRILLPFLLGIISYKFFGSLEPSFFICTFLIGLLLAILFRYFPYHQKKKWYALNSLSISLLLLSIGYLCVYAHKVENKFNWYSKFSNPITKFQAELTTPLKETKKSYKVHAKIVKTFNKEKVTNTSGEVILYFKKKDDLPDVQKGDQIVLVNRLKPIRVKGNPGEFNYAAFCRNKGIYHQAFLSTKEWSRIEPIKQIWTNPFDKWHRQIKNILATYIQDSTALGIAQALLTGYRDDIDQEIYTEYTKTGLVHLLAISGLHMGIFYLGAQYFLGLIPLFRRNKKLLIITSLIIMWCFALVTTFPPSVQRASVMFTFLGIGKLIYRKVPSINFLLASAFFLLLIQPHLLWEVGFQLSYAAVLGILLFYKPIRNWWQPKNFILQKSWEIMCVSLAAQLFTFPIALYYFHQVPTLFLFTNILAIPAVTFIIYGEVLLVLCAFAPPLAKLIGLAVTYMIQALNAFIHYTSQLSFVSIQNIHINRIQCLLLLMIPLLLASWLLGKRKVPVLLSLLIFVGVLGISINKKYKHLSQSKLIVYNTKTPYLEYIHGSKYYSPDSIESKQIVDFKQYILEPSHLVLGVKQKNKAPIQWKNYEQFDFGSFANKSILRIRKAYKLRISKPLEVDYLILSDKWIKQAGLLVEQIRPKELIIDGNIPLWKIDELKSQLREVDLPTHYIAEQGAKIIAL